MGGGGYHYGNNGATYTKVGDAMGRAMVKLLEQRAARKPAKKVAKRTFGSKRACGSSADPSTRKAERLLKTALEAEKLGQPDFAKTLYQQILKEHPNTEPARKAAERLKKL